MKARIVVGLVVAVSTLAAVGLLWSQGTPEEVPALPEPAVEPVVDMATRPAPVGPQPLVRAEPVEASPLESDLSSRLARVEDYMDAPGDRGSVHRAVSILIDDAELDGTRRTWVHRKVEQWFDAREDYARQVAAGDMAEREATVNSREELRMLERRLSRRTPDVASGVVDALEAVL